MIVPDIVIEEAFLENDVEAILIKLSTEFYEINIYVERASVDRLVMLLRGASGVSCCAGLSAGEKVFWKLDKDYLNILIGADAETWDIGITLSRNASASISDLLESVGTQREGAPNI